MKREYLLPPFIVSSTLYRNALAGTDTAMKASFMFSTRGSHLQ